MGLFGRIFERRSGVIDPRHPRDPALADLFGALSATASGISVTPESALNCPAVYASVGLLSDMVGTIPLDLFERVGDDARQRASDHPLHALVHDRPNSWQTSAEWRQEGIFHLCQHGNAYSRIRWSGAYPVALEPMHPSRVGVYHRRVGGHAYQYSPPDGPSEILLPAEVLHVKRRPFDRDGLIGISPVSQNRQMIGLAIAAADFLARFFANNAMPKKGIKVSAGMTPESIKTMREAWEKQHMGLENAHRLAFFYGGMEPVDLGQTNSDGEVVALYRTLVADISSKIFGIPPHLIGETEKSTSWGTGIEQQSIGFLTYFVRPWFEIWEQALDRALLTGQSRKRYFFEFNADGLLRGDFKARMEGYALMIQWGLMTPNEVRRLMNLPAIPGGDSRLQPLNMAPAEKIMDILLKPAAQATRALEHLTGQEATDNGH
jgi:HK97 family phage portal protein